MQKTRSEEVYNGEVGWPSQEYIRLTDALWESQNWWHELDRDTRGRINRLRRSKTTAEIVNRIGMDREDVAAVKKLQDYADVKRKRREEFNGRS